MDNPLAQLMDIATELSRETCVYIDDIHHSKDGNRVTSVVQALNVASVFIVVPSVNYLRTPWTIYEFEVAHSRRLPLSTFSPNCGLRRCTYDEVWASAYSAAKP